MALDVSGFFVGAGFCEAFGDVLAAVVAAATATTIAPAATDPDNARASTRRMCNPCLQKTLHSPPRTPPHSRNKTYLTLHPQKHVATCPEPSHSILFGAYFLGVSTLAVPLSCMFQIWRSRFCATVQYHTAALDDIRRVSDGDDGAKATRLQRQRLLEIAYRCAPVTTLHKCW